MLFPFVESCVPEDLLRTWLRCPVPTAIAAEDSSNSYTSKLQQLLSFLKLEVEGEERINMAKSGFKSVENSNYILVNIRKKRSVLSLLHVACLLLNINKVTIRDQ